MNLHTVEMKAFVPAKDFELSKQFYETLGFEKKSDDHGIAYFVMGNTPFLLQDFFNEAMADNFMMHLMVEDADAWYEHVQSLNLSETFGSKISAVQDQPWRMRDFAITDPSGVLWRIGHHLD